MLMHLIIYTHKHGDDYALCRTEERALEVGYEWAKERREELRTDSEYDDHTPLDSISDHGEYIDRFNAIEAEWSGGEEIRIEALNVID